MPINWGCSFSISTHKITLLLIICPKKKNRMNSKILILAVFAVVISSCMCMPQESSGSIQSSATSGSNQSSKGSDGSSIESMEGSGDAKWGFCGHHCGSHSSESCSHSSSSSSSSESCSHSVEYEHYKGHGSYSEHSSSHHSSGY